MVDYDVAVAAVDTYLSSLENADHGAIMSLYDDNATVEDPVGSEPVFGRDAIAAFYEVAVNAVKVTRPLGAPRVAGDEVAFPFEIEVELDGNAMKIQVIDLFRFNEAGKIVSMRAFWGAQNTIV